MKKIVFHHIGFLIVILFCPALIYGQACCSGGTPLSSGLGIQPIEPGMLSFQLTYEYNTQQSLVEGSIVQDDKSRARNTHSALLRTSYAFDERWSATALLSMVRQEEKIYSESVGDRLYTASGVGDVVLLLQNRLFSNSNSDFLLAGGVKLPVGATDRINEETGISFNPDMQPGTGAWDGIFGLNYVARSLIFPSSALSLVATYRLTFPDDRFDGRQKYEFGDEIQALFGWSDTFLDSWISPSLLFRYRATLADQSNGVDVNNTGGHWLHLVPGVEINFSPQWTFSLNGEIPLYRNLKGIQLTTSYTIKAGVAYSFDSN